MSLDYPQDMQEVKQKFEVMKADDSSITEEDVLRKTVEDAFQSYLTISEEGHYDTGTLKGEEIEITDIFGKKTNSVKPKGDTFEDDFKKSPTEALAYLESQASRVARG